MSFYIWFWVIVAVVTGTFPLRAQEQVLPAGVTLPAKGGTYIVETNSAESKLIQLHASEIRSNSHAASNFARSMVYSGPRASVELEGLNSAIHVHGTNAFILVRLSDDDSDLLRSQLTLVRLRQVANRRVVSTVSQNIFGGQRKREYDVVPIAKADISGANWVKLTPVQPLAPGEYGIVAMPKDPNLYSGTVYDFDIDVEEARPDKK